MYIIQVHSGKFHETNPLYTLPVFALKDIKDIKEVKRFVAK
ncbi:hypothetical protein C1A50_5268 [Paenibacillus polymyxa]|nr:hypothetical protein C1A50_5268 [Paenibacillus polymyxa]